MRVKQKIPSFIFGLSVGLLTGIAFFIFKLDDYFSKLKNSTTEHIKIIEQSVINPEKKSENKTEKPKSSPAEHDKSLESIHSPEVNYEEIDAQLRKNEDESIHLAKEELLSVKNVKLINLDPKENRDTLSSSLAGVTPEQVPDLFYIEFWQTPLNSRGYRMAKNRIILYGVPNFSNVTIYKVDDNFYLKCQDQVYRMTSSTEFRSLERVSDTGLLARIN